MLFRTALCAALMVPVMGINPAANTTTKSSVIKPVVMSTDVMSEEICPAYNLGYIGGTSCEWVYEVCSMPLFLIEVGECHMEEGGCPCDATVAAVRLPDANGQPAFAVRNRKAYGGIQVAPNAYRGVAPPKPVWNEGVEMIFDGPAVIAGKPYRLMSLTFRGQRFDIGREMVGVNAETKATYPKAQLVTVFGNHLQAAVSVKGTNRIFQLRNVGESSVKPIDVDKPLVPTPDNTVPKLN